MLYGNSFRNWKLFWKTNIKDYRLNPKIVLHLLFYPILRFRNVRYVRKIKSDLLLNSYLNLLSYTILLMLSVFPFIWYSSCLITCILTMPLWGTSRRFREDEDNGPITLGEAMDENFACMRRMAKSMCLTLGRPKDRLICRNTLEELAKFNKSESIEVKQNVRKFMRFYLQVLRWTQTHQPSKIYEKWVRVEEEF